MYIADQKKLSEFSQRALKSTVLAIDTEFLNEKTYYEKLCLLQFATDEEVVLVDPFALEDLSVLSPVLTSDKVVKVFHAGYQDIKLLLRDVGVVPRPLFDTQVAAALLGHVQQIGLAALVKLRCGITLKKTDSYTDWSRRPLSSSQLRYAASDVVYLPRLYKQMKDQLRKKGRLEWLQPEFDLMSDPGHYETDKRERYRSLRRVSQLLPVQLAAAREIAAWREEQAQQRNIPRKWVLSDEEVVEACKREPKSIDDLFMVRGLSRHLSTADARTVLSLMLKASKTDPSTWPEIERSGKKEPNVDASLDLMNALVRLRAKEHEVAIPTLASTSDLIRLARGYRDGIALLQSWRRHLVGEELVDLLEGRLNLWLHENTLEVEKRSGTLTS